MARRRYKRKSHLAAAINRQSMPVQIFWFIVIVILFIFSLVMSFAR